MKYLGRAALVLGVASLLTSCGTIGPVRAERQAFVAPPASPVPPPAAPDNSLHDYGGAAERARADQAAYETGHCPLHNPVCH